MKGTKVLLSFWLATAAFCLLQIVYGPGGVVETQRLREYQARLDQRLEALRQDNARLTARYEALRTSPEAIRLEARELGWFDVGSIPIRTVGGAEFRLPSDAPDLSALPPPEPATDLSWFFRLAWPVLFVIWYSLLVLVERLWPSTKETGLILWQERSFPALSSGLDFFRK